jgi:hypothetical protein
MSKKSKAQVDKDQYEKTQYEDALFDRLSDSLHPEDFARYIEEGGELTEEMRVKLAKLVRNKMPKPRGNKDRARDLAVYWEVEEWREKNIEDDKAPSCDAAYRHFANTRQDDEGAIKDQYVRGRKLLQGFTASSHI